MSCLECGREARLWQGFCRTCYNRVIQPFQREKPLAATRPRQQKRRADAKITRRQVFAAWELYQAGWSTSELAERGWEKWGYANKDRAAIALQYAFAMEGFRVRTRSERRRLAYAKRRGCVECSGSLDDVSEGCRTCRSRRWERDRYARGLAA